MTCTKYSSNIRCKTHTYIPCKQMGKIRIHIMKIGICTIEKRLDNYTKDLVNILRKL